MNLFDSHVEAGQMLGERDRQAYYAALVEFVAYGKEPQLKGAAAAVMTAIMPNLVESRRRAEAGAKGGSKPKRTRSKTLSQAEANDEANTEANTEANAKQIDGKAESKTAFFEKAKGKGKGNKEAKASYNPPNPPSMLSDDDAEFAAEALRVFNAETGSNVMALDPRSWDRLATIRASGRTIDDVRAVVRSKSDEWGGDERMRRFIRPSTLFGDKFEEYLATAGDAEGGGDFAAYD